MKTKLSFLGLALLLLFLNGCIPSRIINGNGELVTEIISITDYDKIQTAGSVKVNYTQSEEAPFFEVTTDSNIFEKFEFIVSDDGILRIRPKQEFRRGYNFRPTQFTVTTNSTQLHKAELAGSSQFHANSTLTTDDLKINIAGSGTIHLHESVTAKEIYTDIAGSGTFIGEALYINRLKGEVAGSGTIILAGNAEKATFNIAGSGEVRGYDFTVDEMKCEIAGSGDIEMTVNQKIDASIAGSGRIKYKGDATDINRSVAGSGSIKKVD